MVSCAESRINVAAVHIVFAAWIFVVGTMALASDSAAAGIALFAVAGLAPLAFHAFVKLRRLASRSRFEQRAHQRDDGDPGRDQR